MSDSMVTLVVEAPYPPLSRANLRMYRLGIALTKRGYRVSMVSPSSLPFHRYHGSHDGIYSVQYAGLAVLLYRSLIRFFVALIHLLSATFFLSWFSKKNNVHIIHAWHPIAGLSAVFAAKITGAKVFLDWTDLYSEIVRHESPIFSPVARWIERYIARNADQIFTVSDEMKTIIGSLGASSDKIGVVPDGVDDGMFKPNLNGWAIREKYNLADGPVAIFHGDVKYIDGVDILMRAFALAQKQIPNAKLLIVGGGRGYYDEIRRLTVQLGIAASVVFIGWVPHQTVPEFIAAADVGVMPLRSTLQTNCYLSFKIFEYWAMGKPVIVSRLKAISSIAKNDVNSVLVEPDNIEGFAEALVDILRDRENARSMGRNGRICVERDYSWNKIMEREATSYDAFLKRGSLNSQA